ncbi:CRISPR-associated protein Csx19 [Armatimonas sp.]|uniref:type III-D CRISPR-associated protein Csx19 n=1 Tax=Armatimonas sp. TaxID=1872638 RepID=UPI003752014A
MARAFTYAGTSSAPIAAAFLLYRAELPVALIERIGQISFAESTTLQGPQDDDVEVRAFGESAELRWRSDSGHWHALFLSEDGDISPPSGFTLEPGNLIRYGEPRPYALWGESREGGAFREGQRLPRPLHYPGVAGAHAAIQVALYSVDSEEAENPLPSIVRYVKLVAANPE